MLTVDVLVVGGGMVGAACALGLAKQGKTVAMVEAFAPTAFAKEQKMDLRISAISKASKALLEKLNVWQHVLDMRACPYESLITWEQEANTLQFDAKDLGLSELGFMVENRIIQLALWQGLKAEPTATLLCPHRLSTIKQLKEHNEIVLDNGEQIKATLIIGADGANSWVRNHLKIGVTAWDYRHHCMLIHIKTKTVQPNATWQQFTPNGPVAFLPFVDDDACLVWYAKAARISELKVLNKSELRKAILQSFPKRLGDIEVINFDSFALTRRHAQHYYQGNIVLLGDAAHTINPLAGQGVNLGFKDVDALLFLIEQGNINTKLGDLLKKYQCERHGDNLLMQSAMDVFYKGFSNDIVPVKWLRNFSLKAIQHSGPIKKQILKYAIGINSLNL